MRFRTLEVLPDGSAKQDKTNKITATIKLSLTIKIKLNTFSNSQADTLKRETNNTTIPSAEKQLC